MEMSYLGIYEWVYEKVLSSIVTPVFDFVVSIINIAWGYVFQYILGPILLPVLQVVFYWVIRVVEVLGAFMNYLQFIGYLMVVDCLEKAFDIFIGLEPVTYYPNGREGAAVTGSLLEVLFTSTAISEAFKVITLGGASLIDRGYAYFAGGNVYFDTSKLEKYYVFNDHDEEDLAVGVREGVEEDANKRNKNDFVLWFTKSKFEDQALKWDSPWGVGYPGWHIECSCISMKYLGEHLDIHCGGIDNAFPHHTNEIAQSEAYLGHPWCKYWVHIHHLNTNSGKMSKSKGEFLTVSLLEEKGYDPLVYRFFCLQSHYRKGLVFSWENLDNAKAAYDKLVARVAALSGEGTVDEGAVERFKNDFLEAVGNDLNTSLGVTALYDVLKAGVNDATKRATLDSFDQVLGLELLAHADALKAQQAAPVEGAEEIEALIAKRLEAKKAKNWAEADAIRDQLRAMGVEIKDGKDGTTWTRV